MNYGTKVRTILGILTTINTVLAVTDVAQFGNDRLTLVYKIASVVVNAIIVGINTYYNNDYTAEAAAGTGLTRQLKAEKKAGYQGEVFYNEVEDPIDTLEEDDYTIEEIEEEIIKEEE